MLTEEKSPNTTDMNLEQSPSNGGTNANQKDNLHYSTKPIDGTPLVLVHNENGYTITIGRSAIMHYHETEIDALAQLPTGNIDVLVNLISCVVETITKELKIRGEI